MQHPLVCPSASTAALAAAAVFGTNAPVVAADSVQEYSLGGAFSVLVDQGAPSVEIYTTNGGEEVWKTPTTAPFISSSTGLTNFSDSSGNFEITSNVTSRCVLPQINAVSPATNSSTNPSITLTGAFADASPAHCRDYTWSLAFSANATTNATHPRLHFAASVDDRGSGVVVDNVHLAYASPHNESFYGLGEQTGIGNLRGWRIPVWTREGGVGRGEQPVTSYLNDDASVSGAFAGGSALTTYTAIASVVSTLGRWVVLEGSAFSLWDLASNETWEVPLVDRADEWQGVGDKSAGSGDVVEILYEGAAVSGFVGTTAGGGGNRLLEATGALTEVTGRQPELPDWAHDGAILGIQGGQEKVEGIVKDALAVDMPLVSVWLQDWSGTRLQAGAYNVSISRLWWNWEADSTLYPTWAEWVPHLRSEYGVRTMSYVNTFLANVSSKTTGYNRSFYAEASAEGRFVLNATAGDGSPWTVTSGPGIDAGLLDLSNETTRQWFKDLYKEQYYSVPISGAMQDFGEYLDVDSTVSISSGTVSPRIFHNEYPAAWAKLLREVVEELGIANDTIGFHRSATTFSLQDTNLFWVGDQNIDESREDGMRAAVSSALHVGFSGFAQSHADVGGYTNTLATVGNITRSAALLGRWGEMGAFGGAAFRTHEGNIPQVNAQTYTNTSTLEYHAYNARLYVALKAYRKALLAEYRTKGWPLLRHPAVYAPGDERAVATVDEVFWLGEALLVAPVYDVAAQRLEVYLPRIEVGSDGAAVDQDAVQYKHLWTGQLFEPGKTVEVDAPWGKPGIFVRWPLKEGEEELLQGLWDFVKKENGTALTA